MASLGVYDAVITYIDEADDEQEIGLIFFEEGGAKRSEQLVPLRQVRQDTGNNPNTITPFVDDTYGQNDFTRGMLQRKAIDPLNSPDPRAYLFSRGFDITEYDLRHDYPMTEIRTTAFTRGMCVAASRVWGATGSQLFWSSNLSTWNTETVTGIAVGAAINQVISAGEEVFLAVNEGGSGVIYRRSSSGTWTQWFGPLLGTIPSKLLWAKDRLFFTTTGGEMYEQAATGTGNETLVHQFSTGWIQSSMWVGGSYIYVASRSDGERRSVIHHFGLAADASAVESKGTSEMAIGAKIYAGAGTVGITLLVGSLVETENTTHPVLFLAEAGEDGSLAFQLIAKGHSLMTATAPYTVADSILLTEDSAYIYWPTGSGDPLAGESVGLARYNYITGAFTLLDPISSTASLSDISVLTRFNNRILLSGPDTSVWAQDLTKVSEEATFISSIIDWGNSAQKGLLWTEVSTEPLPAETSVAIYYTLVDPQENDWTLLDTIDEDGSTGGRFLFPLGIQTAGYAIKLVSSANTAETDAPVIKSWSVHSDVTVVDESEVERLITLYILIADGIRKDDFSEPITINPRTIRDEITALSFKRFDFEEPDGTWRVKMTGWSDYEPTAPIYGEEPGTTPEEVYVMQLQLQGSKT